MSEAEARGGLVVGLRRRGKGWARQLCETLRPAWVVKRESSATQRDESPRLGGRLDAVGSHVYAERAGLSDKLSADLMRDHGQFRDL